MVDHHAAASGMDMPAHEEMYEIFVNLATVGIAAVLCIVLLLLIWGIEGHGGVALIGLILTTIAAGVGGATGLAWRAIAPIFLLLGLAAVVLH